jgi:pimeloyl-ACP methyl ester carboxylesterase
MRLVSRRRRHLPSGNSHWNFSAEGLALRKKTDLRNVNGCRRRITVTHQILFIQGGGAGAYEADQQLVVSLRRALGTAYELLYPNMPHESESDYRNWKTQIGKKLGHLKNGAILVGHSLGGSFY